MTTDLLKRCQRFKDNQEYQREKERIDLSEIFTDDIKKISFKMQMIHRYNLQQQQQIKAA